MLAALIYVALAFTCTAQLSAELLGAMRHVNIDGRVQWGAGVDIGYAFNKEATIIGHVRAISYSDNDWRGGVVDEGSALLEANLFTSANKKVSLAAIGGADRDFEADDWGFSVGLRPSLKLTENLSLVADSRIRAWFKQDKDIVTTLGLCYWF